MSEVSLLPRRLSEGDAGARDELRLFGGLSVEETAAAAALEISPAAAKRHWSIARLGLDRHMQGAAHGG